MFSIKCLKWVVLSGLFFLSEVSAQVAYQSVHDRDLYVFLEELSAQHYVDLNSSVKPYSRAQIAVWLDIANQQRSRLSRSQRAVLDSYLQEFSLERGVKPQGYLRLWGDSVFRAQMLMPEVVWRDAAFRAQFRPVYGYRNFRNENQQFWTSYGGAEVSAYMGKAWGVQFSLRDNHQNGQRMGQPGFFTHEQGGNYKDLSGGGPGGEFSEMRGAITYSWAKGHIGLVKDHIQWGPHQHGSNIFSGKTPSFAMLKLHLEPVSWLEFDYFHGWLVSEVIDSVRSFHSESGRYRARFREKYIAANMYTLKPLPRLQLAAGNSIVYSDMDVHPAYLFPFFFFKSLDHTLNRGIDNQNSQMFFTISSRQIPYLHLYLSYFVDEFSLPRLSDPERNNFTSTKLGFSLSGWPLKNLSLGGEFTRSLPLNYKHDVETTTFETNRHNLGHYLRDNSEDYYLNVRYRLFSTLELSASWSYAWHGNEYDYIRGVQADVKVDRLPVLDEKSWDSRRLILKASMQPLPRLRIFGEYQFSQVQGYELDGRSAQYYLNLYTPAYLHGKTQTLVLGFQMGI